MSKKIGLLLAVMLLIAIAPPAFAQVAFQDVPQSHWAYQAVDSLAKAGLIEGYPDGQFKGNRAMTRYEFAMVVARMMDKMPKVGTGEKGEPGEAGKGLTPEQEALLAKLQNEFAPELIALREADEALAKRVSALEDWRNKMGEGPAPSSRAARHGARFAYPTSLGPTGLLNVPTAEAVAAGSFEMMLAYDRPEVAGEKIEVFPIATLGYGFGNGEIGLSYFDVRGNTAVKSANAKYIFLQESEESPSIALGAMYLRGNVAETDLYLVATKGLGAGGKIRPTVGLLYQKPSHGASSSNLTGMLGLEFGTPGQTTLGIDYILDDIAAGRMFGATIRQPVTPDLALQVGVGNDARYFFGMTMKFGGK